MSGRERDREIPFWGAGQGWSGLGVHRVQGMGLVV